MPKNLKRYYGAGDLHFITCSCYHRQPGLGSARRRDLLLAVLEQVRQRYGVVVLGYVVMPEHFHLLIGEPQRGTPSVVMQALKLGFARRLLNHERGKRQPGLREDTAPVHLRHNPHPQNAPARRFQEHRGSLVRPAPLHPDPRRLRPRTNR